MSLNFSGRIEPLTNLLVIVIMIDGKIQFEKIITVKLLLYKILYQFKCKKLLFVWFDRKLHSVCPPFKASLQHLRLTPSAVCETESILA